MNLLATKKSHIQILLQNTRYNAFIWKSTAAFPLNRLINENILSITDLCCAIHQAGGEKCRQKIDHQLDKLSITCSYE